MILTETNNMYNQYDFIQANSNLNFVGNKLFCTFTSLDNLDNLLANITGKYSILYNKIFVLKVLSNEEYVCTYNIEQGNIEGIIDNTIMVHRKKLSNTLYSLNALNELISKLNNGKMDSEFQIDWNNYRNTILLTQQGELKQLKTKIFKIINL